MRSCSTVRCQEACAYTSVAHMGFVVLGVFAFNLNGLQGGLIVMISHGISTGALFLLLGMLYERRHTREIKEFGGNARVAPWLATAFVITALASNWGTRYKWFHWRISRSTWGLRRP
ncbi:MAG: hypothetical protein CM1200mP14_24980 [Gammaproteobacteria bacterium]|nr:MAG: hypothetical protein CM1200mP14_24980 [Gammaproteobacteria bacterium]